MNHRLRFLLALGLALLLLAPSVPSLLSQTPGGGKKEYPDPLPRKDRILKRFAEEFVLLTPGQGKFPASFAMGTMGRPGPERPIRTVTLRQPFAIARYEVTQELYHVVMGKNPSKWTGPRNSVEMVNWPEAQEFCRKATAELRRLKLLDAKEEIRLPTEAEWEYACRAGTDTPYSFGADVKELTKYAWYKDNSKGYDPPVGAKKPNPWGLYDMHGYNREWCADDWQADYQGAPTDGSARKVPGATDKVVRSGSWADPAEDCRSASRSHQAADYRDDKIGFRCVRAPLITPDRKGINSGR